MTNLAAFAVILAVAAQDAGAARPGDMPGQERPRVAPSVGRPGADKAAEDFLRHIYAVYLAIRACTEAGQRLGKPEFMPVVSLEEARRTMRTIDDASKEVGLDVDRIWVEVGPLGLITAEAVKADTPTNLANCARMGGVFRVDLGNLQNALKELGSTRALIEKDY